MNKKKSIKIWYDLITESLQKLQEVKPPNPILNVTSAHSAAASCLQLPGANTDWSQGRYQRLGKDTTQVSVCSLIGL